MEKDIQTIEAYVASREEAVQPILRELWQLIREAAPEAEEKISWGMATFTLRGNLVHFAAEKHHIGFHPGPSAVEAFQAELSSYRTSKGTVRFPYDRPLPAELIRNIVRFRVAEQLATGKSGLRREPTPRQRYEMPEDCREALIREGLMERYEARPPYQRNDYLGWIGRAKRQETRAKRLRQMLDELHDGDRYMGMAYRAKTK